MKKVIISLLASVGLVASASAALSVYTGASVGYLVDTEEALVAVRIGTPFNIVESEKFGKIANNVELEIGYVSASETDSGIKVDQDTIPVMINYRVELQKKGWAPYGGIGLGASVVKGKISGWFGSDSGRDTVFTTQIFLGANYNFDEAWSLKLGARYVHLAAPTVDLLGTSIKGDKTDDGVIEAGFTFRF